MGHKPHSLTTATMSSRWSAEKHEILKATREMVELRLVTGTSGNASLRLSTPDEAEELLAVTPAGKSYASLTEDDILVVDFDVEPLEGDLSPSLESLLHVAIYKARPDVRAIIHTHGVFCSIAAVAGLEIPPIIDEMMVTVGGAVGVSKYAFPGTKELAHNVCAALGERKAALIKNHGAVGVGGDLREALDVCALVEHAAQVFIYASLLGKVDPLPPEVVEAELSIYRMQHRGTDEAP